MRSRLRLACLALANILITVAILTFAAGFFPHKPFLPGLAVHDAAEHGEAVPAPFDKVIFMVVDALRSDFVFGQASGFEFTQGLIRNGSALPFTAHATSPTVTMPRVKALTTGGIPSFLDVILNFAESDTTSSLAHQDTWLSQIKAKGGQLVMHGDDTWLKLFPETFARADGTTSFFVSDFTEVDNNVTRHVPEELRTNDWNALILHYLGLDHIGHKAGPLSPNMVPKQREMDGIVKQAYEAITSSTHLKDTLLIVCGDHGMTDGGNHGGSAPGETSPALVFISPKFRGISEPAECPTVPSEGFEFYTKIEQSDIVPTLAGLLGLPISLNNLGVFIAGLLPLWADANDHTRLLLGNAKQLLTLVKATFPHEAFDNPYSQLNCPNAATRTLELACKWRRITDIIRASGGQPPPAPVVVPALVEFCTTAQQTMSSTASNYNITYLLTGIGASAASMLLAGFAASAFMFRQGLGGNFYNIIVLLYGLLMFASSFVEEEHHFWYWTTSLHLGLVFLSSLRKASHAAPLFFGIPYSVLSLPLHRIIRAWNQTGQKYAGAPDLVKSFLIPNPKWFWVLVATTYFTLSTRLGLQLCRGIPEDFRIFPMSAAAAVIVPAFVFKLSFTARDAPEVVASVVGPNAMRLLEELPLVFIARVVFFSIALSALWVVGVEVYLRRRKAKRATTTVPDGGAPQFLSALREILTVFLVTQTRAHNVPLFLLFHLEATCLAETVSGPVSIALTCLLAAHTSFFALGNTNAISSIDLSTAYNGVSGFNVGVVGLLIFLSNWAGPLWWSFTGLQLLAQSRYRESVKSRTFSFLKRNQRAWIAEERERLANSAALSAGQTGGVQDEEDDGMFFAYISLQTIFITGSSLAIMVACTVLQTHLFIWTVFSPKYLYTMAWCLGWHLIVCCGVMGAVWWAVTLP